MCKVCETRHPLSLTIGTQDMCKACEPCHLLPLILLSETVYGADRRYCGLYTVYVSSLRQLLETSQHLLLSSTAAGMKTTGCKRTHSERQPGGILFKAEVANYQTYRLSRKVCCLGFY